MAHDTGYGHDEDGGPRIGDFRALTVEQDLAAIDFLSWREAEDFAMVDWDCDCESCARPSHVYRRWIRLVLPKLMDRAPLTIRPFASLRVAA